MNPDLVDLIDVWLKESAPTFYVRKTPKEDLQYLDHIGLVYRKGFGSYVTIYKDHICISDNERNPDGLTIMAADPKFFELLSNRLYILEQGFIKAENSRIETAKRDPENRW